MRVVYGGKRRVVSGTMSESCPSLRGGGGECGSVNVRVFGWSRDHAPCSAGVTRHAIFTLCIVMSVSFMPTMSL